MLKKWISLFLAVCLLVTVAPAAFAADINDSSVFLKQSKSDTCTYTAAAMMMRRRAIIDGGDWASITENSVRNATRAPGGGMYNSYTYQGMSVKNQNIVSAGYATVAAKKDYFISLLSQHPEGVVAYNRNNGGGQWHAVLMTDYDASSGTFYCADPSSRAGAGRIAFGSSSIYGSGQDGKFGSINNIWYITNTTPPPPQRTRRNHVKARGICQWPDRQCVLVLQRKWDKH